MTTLTSITVWRAELSFRVSFRHNLAERKGTETLLLRIGTSNGGAGYGQVLPRAYLTGETLEGALSDIRERWWPRLRGVAADAASAGELLRPLFEEADGERRNAGFAGVDVAVRAAAGFPVPESGGVGGRKRLDLVGVIPAASPGKAALLARMLRFLGYRRFKVKVGTDVDADSARVSAVRRAIGSGAWLAADANAAWGWDEAVERMRGLRRDFGVALIEEPLAAEVAGEADFRELERLSGVDAMADESVCTLLDAKRLLVRGSPSWWNIRLAKNGGFSGVNRLAEMAREHDVKLYGGILVGETGALASAGRHSFFETGAECGEYGFSRVFIRNDPFRGSPAGYRGYYLSPDPDGEKGITADISVMPGEVVFSNEG